ncbi:MAG: CoA-binding protein [Bacteroidia bacterium]|nr:CoA-binding protein [Bacteroidia bacterium]
MQKPTLVLGASTKPERYSYKSIEFLLNHKHKVYAVGNKNGEVKGVKIYNDFTEIPKSEIHTVTLYLNKQNQKNWYKEIIELKPKRVIFNPGAENYEFEEILNKKGIETIEACTLVLLNTGQY